FRELAVPALFPRQLLSFGSLLADRAAMLFHVALAARRLEAETASVAARRDLAKDTGLQSQHPFGDEVNHVVREVGVEPRRGIHDQRRGIAAFDPHAVAPRARLDEIHPHRMKGRRPQSAALNSVSIRLHAFSAAGSL